MLDVLALVVPAVSAVPAPGPRPVRAGPGLLSGAELTALQLVACGYSVDQVAGLRGAAVITVLWDLQRALTTLRAPTVRQAVATARHRGLIL